MPDPVIRPRVRLTHPAGGESKTRQDQKDSTDINKILARYRQTGNVTHVATKAPSYGDFSLATDLQTMLTLVEQAEDHFDSLPAAVRQAADNDPVTFLTMLADPEGERSLSEAGLTPPERDGQGVPKEQPAASQNEGTHETPPPSE